MATAIGPARQRLGGTFVAFATALAVTACSSPAAAQPGTPSPRDRIFVTEESASRDSHRPRRLTESTSVVFVSDDRCIDAPGCDAVSAFGLPVPQLLLRGPHLSCSPGRLAGSEDLSIVVAQPANGTSNSLQISTRTGPDVSDWQADLVESRSAVLMIGGGLALSPDGSEVIVAVSDSGRPHSLSFWPPYSVRKYALSEIASGALGPERGRWTVGEGIPYEVLVTQDGHLAHVVTNRGDVITLAVDSMAQVAPPIEMDRPPYSLALVGSLHATLSPEEDLLVTNLVDDGEIVVADLERRTAKSVLLPSAHQTNWVGGVAFNHGPANHGLLAVHRQTQIDVYRVAPPTTSLGSVSHRSKLRTDNQRPTPSSRRSSGVRAVRRSSLPQIPGEGSRYSTSSTADPP